MSIPFKSIKLVIFLFVFLSFSVNADSPYQQLLPDTIGLASENGHFGESVLIEDDIAYVGGPGLVKSGGVYIYEFDGINWQLKQIIKSPDGRAGDSFGHNVAVSGNKMLVSAIGYYHSGVNDAGAIYAYEYDGLQWHFKQRIVDLSATPIRHRFGFGVSIFNDLAVVGAPGDSGQNQNQGSALVYQHDGDQWILQQRITASDGAQSDLFGLTVKVDGEEVFIGAPQNDSIGAVYVFSKNASNWLEKQKLQPEAKDFPNYFGGRLDLDAGTLVISDMYSSSDTGAVYVYTSNNGTWIKQQKLTASDLGVDDEFGSNVKLSGNKMLIGAWGDDDMASGAGAAYFFDFDGTEWLESEKIMAADGASFDRFGRALDIDEEKMIVGSYQDNDIYDDSGSIYAFNQIGSTIEEIQKIIPDYGPAFHGFGAEVLMKDDFAFVGSVNDDSLGSATGAVYLYKRIESSWIFQNKIYASDAADGDYFGRKIVDAGNQILVSARGDDEKTGAVYAFELNGDNWVQAQKITATDATPNTFFGIGLDYHQGRSIIGDNSSVYVFGFDGENWVESQKLTPTMSGGSGGAISINGDLVVIGDFLNSIAGSLNGAVYTYLLKAGVWQEEALLTEKEATYAFGYNVYLVENELMSADLSGNIFVYNRVNDAWVINQIINPPKDIEGVINSSRFGKSMEFNETRLVAGALNVNESRIGVVFVFEKINGIWKFINKLETTSGNSDDFFGFSVSIQNQDVMVGAINDDDNAVDSGSVFYYQNVDEIIFKSDFE